MTLRATTTRKERATEPSPNPPRNGRRSPVRTCVGCRTAQPSTGLVRVALRGGRLTTDRTAGGRGAWLCPDLGCLDTAVKRRAFARALKTEVPPDALDELRATITTGSVFPSGARS